MSRVELVVNGKSVSRDVEDRTLLSDFLRGDLGLTGTHVGCDTSQCGACVVHVDGKAVKSCTMLAVQASGSQVTTIEGLEGRVDARLHVIARDMGHYQHIYRARILTLPHIADIEPLMQVSTIYRNWALPL